MKSTANSHDTRLRIGAVSRLTDLSVHVLRKWEKRYGAVEPIRTPGGGRLYSRHDVQRLALIKQLTQAGAPLGEVAQASLEHLGEMAKEILRAGPASISGSEPPASVRLGVVGAALPTLLQAEAAALNSLEFVGFAESSAVLESQIGGRKVDLLVLESPTVQLELASILSTTIRSIGARGAIVVYGFGSRETLNSLRQFGVALMRAPIDPLELQQVALGVMQQLTGAALPTPYSPVGESSQIIPPPRFSSEQVARVTTSTPVLRCECPRHLADIISNLLAFERYSLECESRNESDAALHHFLALTAGRSRAAFEDALAEVAKAEGMDLGV